MYRDRPTPFLVLLTLLTICTLAASPGSVSAETFLVTSADDLDDSVCGVAHCSLREAIGAANTAPGSDLIRFDDGLAGTTISLQSDLPEIVETVAIDATTLPGFACQSSMLLRIDGTDALDGLVIGPTAPGSTIRGLVLGNFDSGRALSLFSDGNVVQCNFIGTDATGLAAVPNSIGIFLGLSASDNLVGTDGDGVDDDAERNVISGNDSVGVRIDGTAALDLSLPLPARNVVAGNHVGPGVDGTTPIGNGLGVLLTATDANVIGTDGDGNGFDAKERNTVSANRETGIFVSGNVDSMPDPIEDRSVGNIIAGNFIGVDASGDAELPNGTVGNVNRAGVWLDFGAVLTIIGTDGDGTADLEERNVIAGNEGPGILIEDANSRYNVIAGNHIGVGLDGSTALPNGTDPAAHAGVRLVDTFFTRIGTDGDGVSDELERNVISGNVGHGILLLGPGFGTDRSVIAGNTVGLDASGAFSVPNTMDGISVTQNSSDNRIGTDGDGHGDAAERNVVSGNVGAGIRIRDGNATDNVVAGNYVGTDATGTAAVPNFDGVVLAFATRANRVGTDGDGSGDVAERNVVSGNGNHGVVLVFGARENVVAGNSIGTNALGNAPLGNGNRGVHLASGARDNVIGGEAVREGNHIAGNATDGVRFNTDGGNPGVTNLLIRNTLGRLPSGDLVANGDDNVELNNATVTRVAGNRIFGAPSAGLRFNSADPTLGPDSSGNCLEGNASGVVHGGGDDALFQDNWWGAASGPSGVGPGSGDSVSSGVLFTPFLTSEPADCLFTPEADLTVRKSDGSSSIAPGQSSTYTVVVSNAGPNDDPDAELTDLLPSELVCTYTSEADGGATGNTLVGSGDLTEYLDLPAGSSVTYSLDCDVDLGATGVVTNTASVEGSLFDPEPDNDTDTDETAITPAADVGVSKAAGGLPTSAGGTITYTVVASNAGPNDDPFVELSDVLPPELTCTFASVAAGGASGNTTVGSGDLSELLALPVGGSVTYTFDCSIDPLAVGVLTNTATIAGSLLDLVAENDDATAIAVLGALFSDGFETGDTSAWLASRRPEH